MADRFRGRSAIVTGTSDRGFGGAIAERLAREGAYVTLVDRNEPKRLLKVLEKHNCRFHWRQADISKSDEVDAAIQPSLDAAKRLDVVVNAAGVAIIDRFGPETTPTTGSVIWSGRAERPPIKSVTYTQLP